MFYVNNKQIKGMFLNGKNCSYIAYDFSKIIPENRNASFAYINLASRCLNQYRVEYGSIQSGYNNFPIARLDYPVNGIFHSPLTYYYGGNIVPTKNIPVVINNGYCAIRGPVYNDIITNGNVVGFADNSDFMGHTVDVHSESVHSNSPYFNGTVMIDCRNFHLIASSRFSKSGQPTLYNCNNFSGNFKYVGNSDVKYLGFRGFLEDCKDGVFNINCTNMHGGGDGGKDGGKDGKDANSYNFSCISNCNNIRLNINGSPWQAWVHPSCYSSNCNITTRSIVLGFDCMSYCNFNVYLPSNANVEKSRFYSLLSNSNNCNYTVNGLGSNLASFRNGNSNLFLFDGLNNCNLNLILGNSTGLDYSLGNRLNKCNIKFDNINFAQNGYACFNHLSNCNITGNVVKSDYMNIGLVCDSTKANINVNTSLANNVCLIQRSSNINGNAILGKSTLIQHSNNLILNIYNGSNFTAANVSSSKFTLNNVNNVTIRGAYSTNFNMHNATGNAILNNLNNVDFVERDGSRDGGSDGSSYMTISSINNCRNSWIYASNLNGTIENAYNTRIELKNNNAYFRTLRVNNCEITGFPTSTAYTTNCTFNVSIPQALFINNRYITWANVWPHATQRGGNASNPCYGTKAGLGSVDNFSNCYLNCNNGSLLAYGGSENFDRVNNMLTDIKIFYNGVVTANLPNYTSNIKLNVDCHNLNLGVFQAGPPHGFEYSSISADNIFCTTRNNYYVYMNYGTRIYCENFCNVAFTPVWRSFSDNYQPVLLINNYQLSNTQACVFKGGLVRIGRLNYRNVYAAAPLELYNGACMFINNARLANTIVNNSLLFLGTNVSVEGNIKVTNGGLVVNKSNYSMSAISKFVNRNNFIWNFQDSGPWGSRSLLDFCTNV